MQKEILNAEKIKIDVKKLYIRELSHLPVVLIFIPIGNIFITNFIILLFHPGDSFKTIFSCIFYTFFSILAIYDIVRIIIGFIAISKLDFHVDSDWVVDKKPLRYGSRTSSRKPYTLIFAKSGEYHIPEGQNYSWSELYKTTDRNIYEKTFYNDEFYLISIKGRKNCIAYNKKQFEYVE